MTPTATKKGSDVDILVDLTRRVSLLEADVAGLRQQVKRFDYDLQDAVDGFYRRRQSDRMKEVREEVVKKRPQSWADIQRKALARLIDQPTTEEAPLNEES